MELSPCWAQVSYNSLLHRYLYRVIWNHPLPGSPCGQCCRSRKHFWRRFPFQLPKRLIVIGEGCMRALPPTDLPNTRVLSRRPTGGRWRGGERTVVVLSLYDMYVHRLSYKKTSISSLYSHVQQHYHTPVYQVFHWTEMWGLCWGFHINIRRSFLFRPD